MREILFRGKRIDNGEWVEGGYWVNDTITRQTTHIIDHDGNSRTVDQSTVGQYTGLTDKNGVMVFEGDIVRFQLDNDDCPFPNKHIEKIIGQVFYSDWRASFTVTMGENLSDIVNNDLYEYIRGGNRVEVIGNIHDNPELREEVPHA